MLESEDFPLVQGFLSGEEFGFVMLDPGRYRLFGRAGIFSVTAKDYSRA